MAITNASRLADFGSKIGSDVIRVDNTNERIGIGTTNPQALLQVGTGVTFYGNSGIVSATSFYGDGSGLTGVAVTEHIVTESLKVLGITTFVGDVSIGETLTCKNVNGVDSIGVITARTGLKVTSGSIDAVGVLTATSFSGDGSNIDGVQSGVLNFVASGAIDNGKTVVINTDGTVGIVTISTSSTPSSGTPVVYETSDARQISAAFDSTSGKVVVVYQDSDDSGYGKAVVGTVSGTSISFGSPVTFYSHTTTYTSVAAVGSSKVVIVYADGADSSKGKYIVGDISGTTITFSGSAAYFFSTNAAYHNSIAYIGNDKVVISYMSGGSPYPAASVVGTVSGTTLNFGTPVDFEAANSEPKSTIYIGNDKVVVTYKAGSDSDKGKAIVGTVSGTTISFPSASGTFQSDVLGDLTRNASTAYDTVNDRVVIAWRNSTDSNHGYASVGTVTGTSINFGTAVEFNNASSFYSVAVYDASSGKVIVAYRDDSNSEAGTAKAGTVDSSTDTITFGSASVFESSTNSCDMVGVYDSTNEKVVVAYRNEGESDYGTAAVLSMTSTNLTSENYIGIAGEAIANAATGKVNVIGGVNSGQSGLTTAKTYYVGQSGILTTTADTPSVVAGTSISSTKIKVR